MIENLPPLITALREELHEYGHMLDLLERQQAHVVARARDELHESVSSVQLQSDTLQAARQRRIERQSALALEVGLPRDATFEQLLPCLPVEYRPLVQALVAENNDALARIQRGARQNHLLLSRSLELMQAFISSLLPVSETSVYTGQGTRQSHIVPMRPLYEAVG